MQRSRVPGQGGQLLFSPAEKLGVSRSGESMGYGDSQPPNLPPCVGAGTLASRKWGQLKTFRHGFYIAVLFKDHSGGNLVKGWTRDRWMDGNSQNQTTSRPPRQARVMRFNRTTQGEGFEWRWVVSLSTTSLTIYGPARHLQAQRAEGEDVPAGGKAVPTVRGWCAAPTCRLCRCPSF